MQNWIIKAVKSPSFAIHPQLGNSFNLFTKINFSIIVFISPVCVSQREANSLPPALIIIRSLFRCRESTLPLKKTHYTFKTRNKERSDENFRPFDLRFRSSILLYHCLNLGVDFDHSYFSSRMCLYSTITTFQRGSQHLSRVQKPFVRSLVIKLIAFRRSILSLRLMCNNFSLSG